MLLSRARRPLVLAILISGQPMNPATGATKYFVSMATAMKRRTAPTAMASSRCVVVPTPYMPVQETGDAERRDGGGDVGREAREARRREGRRPPGGRRPAARAPRATPARPPRAG